MSIIQVTGGGGSTAADRTSFIGARIPTEVTKMTKNLKIIDKQRFRKLLQIAVGAIEQKLIQPEVLNELENEKLTQETIAIIYSGLLTLLRLALRQPQTSMKQELFKADLQEINIPADFIPDISSVVFGNRRQALDTALLASRPRLPKLEFFRWRVDVGISTSALGKVLEPSITMEMTTSENKTHTFEVPVSKFHELRYSVAYVMKEMEELEQRSVLKIKD